MVSIREKLYLRRIIDPILSLMSAFAGSAAPEMRAVPSGRDRAALSSRE